MDNNYSAKDLIKEKVNIQDIVSDYVDLKPAGTKLKGLSPFSNEKTPSFYVSPSEGYFYCFSTQKGGDIFTFLQEVEGISFKESLQILADRANIELNEFKTDSALSKRIAREIEILKASQEFFLKNINNSVTEYLRKRGIEKKTEDKFAIGYAIDSWDSLVKYLKDRGYSEKEIVSSGLAIEKDNRVYDRFRNRMMFPLIQAKKIIGFAGRTMGDDDAKYINSPETVLYNKSSFIYGFDIAKASIRKHNFCILTEGYLDVILSNQAGFEVAVASSGTSVTEKHLFELKRLSEKIVIAFDGDSAGIDSAIKASKKALSIGMDVRVATLPKDKDPADVVLEDPDAWRNIIKESKTIIEFLLDKIGTDTDPTKKILEVSGKVLPIIKDIKNNLLKEKYIDIISKFCGIDKKSILIELETIEIDKVKKIKKPIKNHKMVSEQRMATFFELKEQLIEEGVNFTKKENLIIEEIEKRFPKENYIFEKKYINFILKTKKEDMDINQADLIKNIRDIFLETGQIILKNLINTELKGITKKISTIGVESEVAILDKKCENLTLLLKTIDTK